MALVVRSAALPPAGHELAALARLIDREALLFEGLPVIDADGGSDALVAALLDDLEAPLAVLAGESAVRTPGRVSLHRSVHLPAPAEGRALWSAALRRSGLGEPVARALANSVEEVAQHFRLGAAAVDAVARELAATATADTDAAATLRRLCRERARVGLEGLAERIEPAATWDDLVLPLGHTAILHEIVHHVRHRTQVYERWGFGDRTSRGLGVTALFTGESGTGKTLAAEVLAAELRLDLYRIDLAATVSKYIGETEKNLRRLFDAAEASGAVLLFDEADALFGKRGEVKDGHDRYANLEVAYLLQRMESYRGLAILTTNLRSNVDRAFLRRLQVRAPVPVPERAAAGGDLASHLPGRDAARGDRPGAARADDGLGRLDPLDRALRRVRRRRGRDGGDAVARAARGAGRVREGRARAHRLRDGRAAMTRLEIVVDELVVRGLPPEQARVAAASLEARLGVARRAVGGRGFRACRGVSPSAGGRGSRGLARCARRGCRVRGLGRRRPGRRGRAVRSRTYAGARPQKADARPVSKPDDRHEREAERAAEVVARGGSVSSWSFSAVPASAPEPVQRQEVVKEKSDEEKKKEALKKAGEAALATPQGQALKEKVLDDPLVQKVKQAVTSPAGIAVTGTALAGGVAALAATGKELPFQPPEIPLDRITPGLSAQVTYQGPVNAPTFVGLSITYKEQGKKGKGGKSDPIAADIARLRAQDELFRRGRALVPGSKEAEDQRLANEAIDNWVLRGSTLPGLTIPLKTDAPKKDEEKTPAQPAPASPSAAPPAHANVDDALTAPGRSLDPSTRRSMEARFGYDFSGVRVHDDARAAATAAGMDAAAFTVGEDVAFAPGRYDPSGYEGRRLLAHELAHVVQQSRGGGPGPGGFQGTLQRRSIFESLGILLGIGEGTWEDRELHAYLELVVSTGRIEGAYDSDNKARAIVRRWKASSPGFDLQAPQKLLLIKEMLDGYASGGDEEGILDLLELSDASDLRAILGREGVRLPALERRISGDNRTRLDTFVAGRFVGGREAVARGAVVVRGPSVPTGAPNFDFDEQTLDALLDGERTAEEVVEIVARFSPIGRLRALHHLSQVRRPRVQAVLDGLQEKARHLTGTPDEHEDELNELRMQYNPVQRGQLKTERVLLHFFLDAAPATAAELRSKTHPVDPARRDELREALHPAVHVTTAGTSAPFRRKLPGEDVNYEAKVLRVLLGTGGEKGLIDRAYEQLVVGRGPAEHADPAKTHPLATFEALGKVAQEEVVKVFGPYLDRPPTEIKADQPATAHHAAVKGNIHDAFADTEEEVRAFPSLKPIIARNHLVYFVQSNAQIARINAEHDATPNFTDPPNAEAKLLNDVFTRYLAVPANVKKLVEIVRNWPGSENPDRSINVQIFRAETPEKDRFLLWDYFQVLIHEVLHTFVSDPYEKYAETLPAASFNTLMEGACSFLTEVVWTNVEPRVAGHDLREKIEGPELAAKPAIDVPHASQLHRYASYTEVLHLVDLVGVQNLYAAYFLGEIDRIGGVLPTPARAGARRP